MTKSELHELKQKWKAARQRWLTELRQTVPGDAESDRLWQAYEKARDVYWAAKGTVQ